MFLLIVQVTFARRMSVQYLLIPMVEDNGYTLKVDGIYWFLGHIVKDQGKTAGLWINLVCQIFKTSIAYLIYLILLNLLTLLLNFEQYLPPERRYPPIDFLVKKGKGQTSNLHPKWCLLIIVWFSAWRFPKMLHWLTLEKILFWVTQSLSKY